jgi:hypothetical protein
VRFRARFVAVSTLVYALVGEIDYRASDPCTRGSPVDYQSIAIAVRLGILVIAAAVLARRAPSAWRAETALNTGVGLGAGIVLAGALVRVREATRPYCGLYLCGGFGCMPDPWYEELFVALAFAAVGAVLALPVGWLARHAHRKG